MPTVPVSEGSVRKFTNVFRQIVMLSLRATPQEVAFGHPCSALIEAIMDRGLDAVVSGILSRSGEYRLNGAGLKLYTRVELDGMIWAKVGGDQFRDYPKTGPDINKVLWMNDYYSE